VSAVDLGSLERKMVWAGNSIRGSVDLGSGGGVGDLEGWVRRMKRYPTTDDLGGKGLCTNSSG